MMRGLRYGTVAAALLVAGFTAPAEAVLLTATNSTQALVDAASTTRTVSLGGSGLSITDVNITIDFLKCDDPLSIPLPGSCVGGGNSFNGEIVFRLTSPDGTTVNLVNALTYTSGVPGAHVTVTFDDAAASAVGGSLLSGTLRPVSTLSAFNGEDPNGTWTLFIQDTVGADPLGVYSYTLDVEAVPEPGTMLLLGSGIAGLAMRRRRRG